MRKLLLLAFVLTLVSSCTTYDKRLNKWCARCPTTTITKDSVIVKNTVTVKDSIIQTPADSAWLFAYLQCDSLGRVSIPKEQFKDGQKTEIQYILKNNWLQAVCVVDTTHIAIQWLENHKETYANHTTVVERTFRVPFEPTWFQFIAMWLGYLWMLAMLILLLFIIKHKLKERAINNR
jgi:hypothetical protein